MSKILRVLEKCDPQSVIMISRNQEDSILFESQALALLTPGELEVIRKQYNKKMDAYGCLGVLQFNSGENVLLYLVLVTGCVSMGKIGDSEVFRITQTQFVSLQQHISTEDKISEVRKLLNLGTFYFSHSVQSQNSISFDITLCAQRRNKVDKTDNRFFWNRMFQIHLMRYGIDCSDWLIKAMCGSIEIRTIYIGSKQAKAAIISRLSCERAGTRFNVRGTNDDGHVANFVETEQVIYLDNEVTSYVQTRGSVPLFWEQPGVQVGSHKVKMSRGFESSKYAFDRHMTLMKIRYGKQAIVNLLGTSLIGNKEGEAMLSQEFQKQHNECENHADIPHIIFDYHQECRGGNSMALLRLKEKVLDSGFSFSMFYAIGDRVVEEQSGTIRTNCLDCLDRTNCVQTYFGLYVLCEQLKLIGIGDKKQIISRFEEIFKNMWISNGNEVSRIYAGTGAIQGGSKLIDGTRSVARTIQNNLLDNTKQEAIDILLLGSTLSSELADRSRILLPANMLHAPTTILREMCRRVDEYVTPKQYRIAVGTYNVNGGKHFRSVALKDSLSDWLLDCIALSSQKSLVDISTSIANSMPVDIFAIGFQEIVDLNASNIVAASSENANLWAEELQKALSRDNDYVILTFHQLVGVCLYVFIKSDLIPFVRDVAIDSVKTGLGGATGNKGACAIRFVLNGSSICIVCAHFAAGQSQVNERNSDYSEITRKLSFPMGRSLKAHDYVFWCGDFNYRIDMDKDELKDCIKRKDFKFLLENDQLRKEQQSGNVFPDFLEGEINFDPTYKYDIFSDDYDTSEKQRAPAWTDRVLWKKRRVLTDHPSPKTTFWNPGKLIYYGRSELKQSDHRPVMAIIDIEISQLDLNRRQLVFKDVIQELGPRDSTIIVKLEGNRDDFPLSIYDESVTNSLIQELSKIGEIALVRYVNDEIWITFKEGKCALNAARTEKAIICDLPLFYKLKTENWLEYVEKEIDLCTLTVVPLCDNQSTSLIHKKTIKKPPIRPPMPKSPKYSPSHIPEYKENPEVLTQHIQKSINELSIKEKQNREYQPRQPHQPPPPPPVIEQEDKLSDIPPPLPRRGLPPVPSRNPPVMPSKLIEK
ncbi:SYNJ1 family protein [Megaselia abdita]